MASEKPPEAFLSYTRFDDQNDGGAISEFRRRLADAVRAVTGEPFEIFQDIDGIGLGERWSGKLDEMLNEARFFIPIITPSYFKSTACRDELEKFVRAEAERGRNDLVLPIYYIECDVLEEDDQRAADSLAKTIHERQRQDWRKLRLSSFSTKTVRTALHSLAKEIVGARRRPVAPLPRALAEEVGAKEFNVILVAPGNRKMMTREVRKVTGLSVEETNELIESAPQPIKERVSNEEAERIKERLEDAGATVEVKAVVRPAPWSRPGTVFREVNALWCPEMVVIPPGEFIMGSTEGARLAVNQGTMRDHAEAEKQRHVVRIAHSMAIGRFPVTFEEYGHFASTTGCEQPADQGWGRGRRPVINVSWNDAKAYVEWLSVQTEQRYRLLSEAEWEYACRAAKTKRYWWGDEISPKNANYGGSLGKTRKVGTYPANPWGLHDMHGNVWEWVEDCWNDSYEGAPDDGSAWTSGDCSRRVLRGGSWDLDSKNLRSGVRYWMSTVRRSFNVGFRVASTLAR